MPAKTPINRANSLLVIAEFMDDLNAASYANVRTHAQAR